MEVGSGKVTIMQALTIILEAFIQRHVDVFAHCLLAVLLLLFGLGSLLALGLALFGRHCRNFYNEFEVAER